MTRLTEGRLAHTFNTGWIATKYDNWSFYQNHFKDSCAGNKAVDFVALESSSKTLWLIELKDYRQHRRQKSIALHEEIAMKVRDSLAGLFAAARYRSDHTEKDVAKACLSAKLIRIVLHLE